jgi:hypothetical protein
VGPARWTTCVATREPGLRLRRVQTPRAAPRTACHESLRVIEARRAQARLRKVERVAERRHATKFLATHDPPAGAIRDKRARPVQGTTPRERSYQGGRSTRAAVRTRHTIDVRARADECASAKNRKDDAIQVCAIPLRATFEQHQTARRRDVNGPAAGRIVGAGSPDAWPHRAARRKPMSAEGDETS